MPQSAQQHWRKSFEIFGGDQPFSIKRADSYILLSRHRVDCLLRCPRTGLCAVIWGRLDNRKALIAMLSDTDNSSTDAELILAGWLKWSRELPSKLIGDFAIAIVNPRENEVFLARDPMGVKPLYYRIDDDLIAFASTASALKLPNMPLTPDRAWMARYLGMSASSEPDRTAYVQISKLPGGSCLMIRQGCPPEISRWQRWNSGQFDSSVRDSKWVSEYKAILDESVAARMNGERFIAIESTGGLDSSAILASAALKSDDASSRIHAYGNALNEQEPELIQAASDACKIRNTHLITKRIAVSDPTIRRIIDAIGYPEENGTASSHTSFYEHASKQKCSVLLSGFGGDQIASHPGYLARYEFAKAGQFENLFSSFEGSAAVRAIRSAKFLYAAKRGNKGDAKLNEIQHERWTSSLLRDDVISAMESECLLAQKGDEDAVVEGVNDHILNYHLRRMDMTTRLENCTLVAALWGIDYRWPLLDARLIQQYLSTPVVEKLGPGGVGRYLHRRAMCGRLPDEIVWKSSKHMGPGAPITQNELLPVDWRPGGSLREAIPEELLDIVDPAKLAKAISLMESTPGQITQRKMEVRSGLVKLRWLCHWVSSDDYRAHTSP